MMRYEFSLSRTVLAILTLAGCSVSLNAQEGPAPANPFQAVDRTITSAQPGPEVLLAQSVRVDLPLLASRSVGAMLNLGIISDSSLTGVVERIEHRSPMRFTIAGGLSEHQNGSFIIVVYDDVAVGVIRPLESGVLYRLRYTSEGVQLIERIDGSTYPPEQCYHSGGKAIDRMPDQPLTAPRGMTGPDSDRGGCYPLPPVYDLLMAYTHLARQAMGSTNAAIAQCQLAVEVGNEAYADSLLEVRLRLVHTMEVDYDEPGDSGDWLDWITGNSAVASARNDYGADFVDMLTSGGTGIGWCGPGANLAYSCAKWTRAVDSWTLVHEMGHNQGCDHNREDTGGECAFYDFAFGHRYMGSTGQIWATVMAYPGAGGIRISNFSHPDIYHDGYPTGVPIGDEGESHCAWVHDLMELVCQEYRLSRYDVWVDVAHGGAEEGSFLLPFDTVTEGVNHVIHGVGATEMPSLWIKPGTSDETLSISTPMVIRACGGLVTIGG